MVRGFTDHSLDKNLLMKNSLEATRLNDDRAITVEYNNNMIMTDNSSNFVERLKLVNKFFCSKKTIYA